LKDVVISFGIGGRVGPLIAMISMKARIAQTDGSAFSARSVPVAVTAALRTDVNVADGPVGYVERIIQPQVVVIPAESDGSDRNRVILASVEGKIPGGKYRQFPR
jgi:hypothetical protein